MLSCHPTEQAVTKNMQMLHKICQHLGLANSAVDEEWKDLAQPTPLTELVEEIGDRQQLQRNELCRIPRSSVGCGRNMTLEQCVALRIAQSRISPSLLPVRTP